MTNTMNRCRTSFTIALLLLVGCGIPDYQHSKEAVARAIAGFRKLNQENVSSIVLEPFVGGSWRKTLRETLTIQDKGSIAAMLSNLNGLDGMSLPKELEHTGAARILHARIIPKEGQESCFLIYFLEGHGKTGIEYFIAPTNDVKSTNDQRLPRNHAPGNGFSVQLYDVLMAAIKQAGGSEDIWVAATKAAVAAQSL